MSGASRNWRRFNFFDRTNIPLPNEVRLDLLPQSVNSNNDDGNSGGFDNNRVNSVSLATVVCSTASKQSRSASYNRRSDNNYDYDDNGSGSNDESIRTIAFIASMSSSRVYCMDVSNRHVREDDGNDDNSNVATGMNESRNRCKGCFEPKYLTVTRPPGSNNENNGKGVRDVAVVNYKNRAIYVATISSRGMPSVSIFRVEDFCEDDKSSDESLTPVLRTACTIFPTSASYPAPASSANDSTNDDLLDCSCIDIYIDENGLTFIAVGTTDGKVLVYNVRTDSIPLQTTSIRRDQPMSSGSSTVSGGVARMSLLAKIDRPGNKEETCSVTRVNVFDPEHNTPSEQRSSILSKATIKLFVCYDVKGEANTMSDQQNGICRFDVNLTSGNIASRVELDGRGVAIKSHCDFDIRSGNLVVARDSEGGGLFVYSPKDNRGSIAALIEYGKASCMSCVPASVCVLNNSSGKDTDRTPIQTTSSYVLLACMDNKSRRDSVDIYDATNKLIAFHVLLSPGHTALLASSVEVPAFMSKSALQNQFVSTALLSSGGTLVALTERTTSEKVGLLIQKNLFPAAISIAYSDPFYPSTKIAVLYRQHAEFLYQKGDFEGALDQYINTIGSLEPSHVIFRYLDALKIPLLVKYLEKYRQQHLDTDQRNEHIDDLLKSCYLKLNKISDANELSEHNKSFESALAAVAASKSPSESLATLCSFEAEEAAKALEVHGPILVKTLPRETAGVVISLCDGTYSPNSLTAARSLVALSGEALETSFSERPKVCRFFPFQMFEKSFIEHHKLMRLILSHCKRAKCVLTPSLRRTHLELTLEEWAIAVKDEDKDTELAREKEAMIALTDAFIDEIGVYEALVIVQLVGFTQGEIILYEKLQDVYAPLLIDHYAADGSERARRQMLAMCQGDPDLLADVLGHFVSLVAEKNKGQQNLKSAENDSDDDSDGSADDIFDDIEEALDLSRSQGVLPAVRIARILAGEDTGQFTTDEVHSTDRGVPLSVSLDYIGQTLDESSKEISRLKKEIEDYHASCNDMQSEIDALSGRSQQTSDADIDSALPNLDINALYSQLCDSLDNGSFNNVNETKDPEEFWRLMGQSDDRFSVIARYFGKGVIQ